jgi:hypothetical protein
MTIAMTEIWNIVYHLGLKPHYVSEDVHTYIHLQVEQGKGRACSGRPVRKRQSLGLEQIFLIGRPQNGGSFQLQKSCGLLAQHDGHGSNFQS